MSAEVESPPTAKPRAGHVPGEPALWVFLLGDMVMFGIFFCVIVVLRGQHTEAFIASQRALHLRWGLVNTLVLMTSSMLVVTGVHLARVRHPRAPQLFLAGAACGLLFVVVKAVDYTTLVREGHTASTGDFYTYYFMFTGIHLAHVLVGTGALLGASRVAQPTSTLTHRTPILEGIASFWHLVDLLWIMLFATLYLMR